MVWYKKNARKLNELRKELVSQFPDLWVDVVNNEVFIRGGFPVIANDLEIDRYAILIKLPKDYPLSPPTVFEINNCIPRIKDRHINPDGSACLFLHDEAWKYYSPNMSMVDFLKGPVNDFFLMQQEIELRGRPLIDARRHGEKGIIDYYTEELGTNDVTVITKFLEYLCKKPKGHRECYCGSNKKIRDCHLYKLQEMSEKIPHSAAGKSLQRLLDYIQQSSIKK